MTLLFQRYALFKIPRKRYPPEEMGETKYTFNYVNLFSQLSFFWVAKLLLKGMKRPLEMKDLGKIPHVSIVIMIFNRGTYGYALV